MKSKTIIAAGVALGLMVLAPAFVQAGGGGAGIPINVFAVDCYVINGVNPDIDVSLDDQFFGTDPATGGQAPLPRRSPVNLGKAKLLCTNSIVGVTSPDTFASNLNAQGELTDHLVCYEMPAQLGPKLTKKVSDPFGNQVVVVGSPAFSCVGALKCDPTEGGANGRCNALP